MKSNLKEICKSSKNEMTICYDKELKEPFFSCVRGENVIGISITDADYKNGTKDKLSAKERHILMSTLGAHFKELVLSYNESIGMPREESEKFKMYGDSYVSSVQGAIPVDFPMPNYLNLR